MDAMQKRRMWKVAAIHFAATMFVIWKSLHYLAWSGPPEREVWFDAWGSFWFKITFLLQPLIFVIGLTWKISILAKIFISVRWLFYFLCLLSMPIWTICFGWLFVKFDNWLNHFPILGRKVF